MKSSRSRHSNFYKDTCGKGGYSKTEAERHKNHGMKTRKLKLWTYLCPKCHAYHLTSTPNYDDNYPQNDVDD